MRLEQPFVRLPLRFDAARLAAEIGAIDESSWRPHPQGYAGNSALPLVSAFGDPARDQTKGPMLPTPVLARLPYVRQVMASFGAAVGRSRLMRLDGNAEATAHVDTNYYWMSRVRIHVPVVTQPEVEFICRDARVHMRAGECWIFDTFSTHNVINPLPTRRIHLVIDSIGSDRFWNLVGRGYRPGREVLHPTADAAAPLLAFDPTIEAQPATERVNQPVVMSPYEVAHWIALLDRELDASALPVALAPVRAALDATMSRFARRWADRFARHGEHADAHAGYAALLAELDRELGAFEKQLRLSNQVDVVESLRQCIVRAALNPALATDVVPHVLVVPPTAVAPAAPGADAPAASGAVAPAVAAPAPRPASDAPRFDRPVFIVSPPRSGSTLMFETIARARDAWTIGGESHVVIEGIPLLHPASHGFESNRLSAREATPMTVAELAHGFSNQLRDRDGKPPAADARGLRLVEKTPKNSLRIPFFAAAFADARFVVLHREPREVLSSMLEAWRSQRFSTYAQLPGWNYPNVPGWSAKLHWSLALAPGWRGWMNLPLHELVARQWAAIVEVMLDDLEALGPDRVAVASYAALVADPQAEMRRVCAFADLDWDVALDGALPLSKHTLTPPDPQKWRRNAAEVEQMLAVAAGSIARLERFVAARREPSAASNDAREPAPLDAEPEPAPSASASIAPAPAATAPRPEAGFSSVFSASLPALLAEVASALVITTYQSGRVIVLRTDRGAVNTHFKAFPSPMGLAVGRDRIALATARQVWDYRSQPALAARLVPPGRHDAAFAPRAAHFTGDIRVHEIGFAQGELWIVNTRFSCLSTLDAESSFVPRWRPAFISALEPSDRCHLNGMCIIDGRVRFVTALGRTDTPAGWRENKGTGGLVIDVASGELVAEGLSMPHSPRWHQGRLWVLESGKGALSTIDLATGRAQTVVELPGFTRGLAFAGKYAFIGLSQVRESVFGGLPLTERGGERRCGVWVVDTTTGTIAGFLRFEGIVQEIFDLQFLPGIRFPEILEPDEDLAASAFVLPDAAMRSVARAVANPS